MVDLNTGFNAPVGYTTSSFAVMSRIYAWARDSSNLLYCSFTNKSDLSFFKALYRDYALLFDSKRFHAKLNNKFLLFMALFSFPSYTVMSQRTHVPRILRPLSHRKLSQYRTPVRVPIFQIKLNSVFFHDLKKNIAGIHFHL